MSTARIRFALVSLVVSLVVAGLGLAAASAQTTDDLQHLLTPWMVPHLPYSLSRRSMPGRSYSSMAPGAFVVQAFDPAHSGDIVSLINTAFTDRLANGGRRRDRPVGRRRPE